MSIQSVNNISRITQLACFTVLAMVIWPTPESQAQNGSNSKRERDGFSFPLAEHRGTSIPDIDLNDRKDLQTVISRDSKIYMGHPSSVLLDDARTMVMMFLDEHGKGRLMWTRSEDAGRSWSKRLPVPEGWDTPLEINGRLNPPFL